MCPTWKRQSDISLRRAKNVFEVMFLSKRNITQKLYFLLWWCKFCPFQQQVCCYCCYCYNLEFEKHLELLGILVSHTCRWAECGRPVWRAGQAAAAVWWRPPGSPTPRTGSGSPATRSGRTRWRCGRPRPWRWCPCWWWCSSSAGRPWTRGSPGLGCLRGEEKRERGRMVIVWWRP